MSLHKITAGDGYEYLTRQVAAMDSTEKGHTGLASYYTEKGETPGVWVGSGLVGIDGLEVGDPVTAEQMKFLFGSGHHPLAGQRGAALDENASVAEALEAVRLGAPFKVYPNDMPEFRIEVARRFATYNTDRGLRSNAPVPLEVRAEIRSEIGRRMFRAQYGRDPADARELSAMIAKASRPATTAVAGFDLTFSPVKSVSTLWALADSTTAATIERAHLAAVDDALRFIETHALFTRTGRDGVRQLDVKGLVAARFTHRDSRAGDPDLHTHVPVANKVQTLDGRWLAIDGRVMYKAIVAASEVYNTALEAHLGKALNVRFEERPGPDPTKRAVRELVGVDPTLNARWSSRRASIERRQAQLTAAFQHDHHRPPTRVEANALAQQANLETRQAKHEPRTLAQQRAVWHAEAVSVLGTGGVAAMVAATVNVGRFRRPLATGRWIRTTAAQIVTNVEGSRSTWQEWHVRAEALRAVRSANIALHRIDDVVARLTHAALARHSVALQAPPEAGIDEPTPLRRTDGQSVYTVAGNTWHTSRRIMAAEQRLLDAAGMVGGYAVTGQAVDVALLEATANNTPLNAGQVRLVRDMAASGARLQLAIAPAGSGKTTAMRALATAWRNGGGHIIGLAPSAAAAAQLGDQIGTHADTMAILTHALSNGHRIPAWADQIGPNSLVIIDEAGMADTPSLDTVVDFVLDRGGSVRLIGDDQQLAAVGAGGILRDIQAHHGALQLNELVRFRDPAEGAASLALRDGDAHALGFYLDNDRIHVGDLTTCVDQAFTRWLTDSAAGADTLMLAPTRALVAELNLRAQSHLRQGQPLTRTAPLADGSNAAVGDVIITRLNSRQLRTTGTDWVRNGDRWTVTGVASDGSLRAQHQTSRHQVTLPASYVTAHVELGYACTIHAAQGVTADVTHGILTGTETRQQLYTMLTRGRHANHVHLEVVGDGDAHSLIRPDAIIPPTATDILENILTRDGANTSATTTTTQLADPRIRLADAVARYSDALLFAAEHIAPEGLGPRIDETAEQLHGGLTDAPAWPTLRAHLFLLSAAGTDPIQALTKAVRRHELTSADDPAAVLDWRLDPAHRRDKTRSPLPWLSGIPTALEHHTLWGDYLQRRERHVRDLAAEVRTSAATATHTPLWAPAGAFRPAADTLADIEVWRAAHRVPDLDTRPTGRRQMAAIEARWQATLDRRIIDRLAPAVAEWTPLLHQLAPATDHDPYLPALAHRLAQMTGVGLDAHGMLHHALAEGALPDDHAASALWWRLARHLTPAVANTLTDDHHQLTTTWIQTLENLTGKPRATTLQASPWWPALVVAIDNALARGWHLPDLIANPPTGVDIDDCQALLWRTSVLLDPIPDPEPSPEEPPVQDLDVTPSDPAPWWIAEEPEAPDTLPPDPADDALPPEAATHLPVEPSPEPWAQGPETFEEEPDLAYTIEALQRRAMSVPEPTAADINAQLDRADAWRDSPHTPQRLAAVNEMAAQFYQACLRGSWAQPYLTQRFQEDLAGDPTIRPGYAPAGWTTLVQHLHHHGVTNDEMLAAGLATTATTGRLIDRFRDRAVFPIIHDNQILGFVGRRHPDKTDLDKAGPKYLNTGETVLFHKRAQLFVAGVHHLTEGRIPVLVEGPADAIAVTQASDGRYVGVAPLGTSLTTEQIGQLRELGASPIVATDNDIPGQVAAQRDYWLLAPHDIHPKHAQLPEGADPAALLADGHDDQLLAALDNAAPLATTLIEERLTNLPADEAAIAAAAVIAAQPVDAWEPLLQDVAVRLAIPTDAMRTLVMSYIRAWIANPQRAAEPQLATSAQLRERLATATTRKRWVSYADSISPRITADPQWGTLAQLLDQALEAHLDVDGLVSIALEQGPLDPNMPARDLTQRVTSLTNPEPDLHDESAVKPPEDSVPSYPDLHPGGPRP